MPARPTRRSVLKWFGAGALTTLGGVAFGDVTSNAIEYVHREIKLPNWNVDGFRVGLIGDTHVTNPHSMERAKSAAQWVVDQNPDVIVFVGDYVSRTDGNVLSHVRESLEPIRNAKCPVIGVMGNHDYYAKRPIRVFETVRDSGVRVLRNEWIDLDGVAIAGVDDAMAQRHIGGMEMLETESFPKSTLALLHEPDFADEMPGSVSLMLSGHSHGGQICLPGGIPIETRIGARNYSAGFYSEAKVPLYVTRGVGTSGPDLRLFCRPEVSILTLREA